jgi:hypothetical protein
VRACVLQDEDVVGLNVEVRKRSFSPI